MKLSWLTGALIALLILPGCGGGNSNSSTGGGGGGGVTVSPSTATLQASGTQQFTASQSGVTWTISPSSGGSISSSGLYTAPSTVSSQSTVTVTATPASGTAGSASVTLIALKNINITPLGPAVSVGGATGTQQLTATGTFSDNSTHDVTAGSSWSSGTTSVASVGANSGLVTGVAPGVATITATNNSTSPAVVASTAVNVTNMVMTTANLTGQYALSITNAGTRGQSFLVASITADGKGNITGGIEDINATTGSTPNTGLSLSGSYSVYPDGRGTLSLKSALGSNTYTFILSTATAATGASLTGKIMLLQNGGVEVGTLELQDSTAISTALNGNYAFLMGGVDGTLATGSTSLQNPEVIIGQFTVTSGAIAGNLDFNNNGTQPPPPTAPITGTVDAKIDANGRGTLQLTNLPLAVSSSGTLNFAYYIVSATKILLIQTDLQSSPPTIPALAGTAQSQTVMTITTSSSYVSLLERSASPGIFGSAGQWIFNASNALAGEMDVNNLGVTNKGTIPASSTYMPPGAFGRGTVTITSGSGIGPRSYVIYVFSNTKIYVMESDNKVNGGVAELQSSPVPTGLSASNPWSLGLAQLATGGNDSSFIAQLTDNANNLAGIANANIATNNVEAQSSTPYPGSVGLIDGNGRGTLTLGTGANNSYGFYAVSPSRLFVFGTKSALTNFQAPDGIMDVQ